jgi:hypothetical protein
VPARLSPADRVRAQIDELFASEQPLAEILEQVARLSIRLVLQTAVEAEVSVFLGRDVTATSATRTRGRAIATATSRSPSRPRLGRSRWSGPSCAAPRSRSRPGCWQARHPDACVGSAGD